MAERVEHATTSFIQEPLSRARLLDDGLEDLDDAELDEIISAYRQKRSRAAADDDLPSPKRRSATGVV